MSHSSKLSSFLVLATLARVVLADGGVQGAPRDARSSETAVAAREHEQPSLGIGFLWTRKSEAVASKLAREDDFVDLILGAGKLDVFEKVKPPVRVICIARSLERNDARPFPGIKETVEIFQSANIPPERVIIGYNPGRQPGTSSRELDHLVDSVQQASKMARTYGAPLLVGPGLREMQNREELYPELAKHCCAWAR